MKLVALTLLAALAAACQTSGPRVQSAMSPGAPFARYHTFSFGGAEGPPVGSYLSAGSWDVQNRLRPVVSAALARKGYAEDFGKADFVVRLESGTADLLDTPVDEDVVNDATTGRLAPGLSVAIDMYDAATGARVWRGATVVATKGGRSDDRLLERIATSAFAELPRASKRGE